MTVSDSDKRHIEAVLYTTGKYMSVQEIAEACEIGSVGIVKEAIKELLDHYGDGRSALEIQEHEGKYKLNIRKEYGFLANKLLSDGELDGPTIKTLAMIAYKSPVLQSEIIQIRGNKAYEHISQLKEDGLVTAEPQGRSRLLKLSGRFFDYFDVAEKEVKEQFGDMEEKVRKETAWKMGTTPEEISRRQELLDMKPSFSILENVEHSIIIGEQASAQKEELPEEMKEESAAEVEEAEEDREATLQMEDTSEETPEEANPETEEAKKTEEQAQEEKTEDDEYVYDGRGRIIGMKG